MLPHKLPSLVPVRSEDWRLHPDPSHASSLLLRPCFAGSTGDPVTRSSTAGVKPADRMTGRYWQVVDHDAPTPAAAAEAKPGELATNEVHRSSVLAEYEQRVAADPGNEELWLLFALQHIDFGAVESMKGMS